MYEAPDTETLLQALQFAIENPEAPSPDLDEFLAAFFRTRPSQEQLNEQC